MTQTQFRNAMILLAKMINRARYEGRERVANYLERRRADFEESYSEYC